VNNRPKWLDQEQRKLKTHDMNDKTLAFSRKSRKIFVVRGVRDDLIDDRPAFLIFCKKDRDAYDDFDDSQKGNEKKITRVTASFSERHLCRYFVMIMRDVLVLERSCVIRSRIQSLNMVAVSNAEQPPFLDVHESLLRVFAILTWE
jgi:hypothetical protein